MSHRRGPVGTGYMPKGGAKQAALHNDRIKAQRAASAEFEAAAAASAGRASVVESKTAEVRTDARASGWPTVTRPDGLSSVVVSAVAAAVVSAPVAALVAYVVG